jgi:hypothetical protein
MLESTSRWLARMAIEPRCAVTPHWAQASLQEGRFSDAILFRLQTRLTIAFSGGQVYVTDSTGSR